MTAHTYPVVLESLWRVEKNPLARNLMMVVAGSLLLWASAKLQVPVQPVPFTFQTLVVLLIGVTFGPVLGGATVLAYLAQGWAGLPVFAGTPEKGIGLAYMVGPTGGYLLGFFLAAVLVGWLARRGMDRNILTMAFAMFLGNLVIYVPGLLWLGSIVGWDKPVLEWGFYPFLAGDALKLLLASLMVPAVWRLLSGRGENG